MNAATVTHQGTEWMESGLCAVEDPDIWDPQAMSEGRGSHDQYRITTAKAICAECPVRDLCLDAAVAEGERHTIRGGVNFTNRAERKAAVLGVHPVQVAAGAPEAVSA